MKINNLFFGYRSGQPLLKGLNLELQPGHIYGLLGQNGAGKTTLLKLMAGLCFPSSGEIRAQEFNPQKRNPDFLQELFFIPEDFTLPALSLQQYAKYYGAFYPKFDADLFKKTLETFNLNPKASLPALSYGQKKLFFTAFGLSTRATLLILDEPSNGLDIPNKQVWQRLLMKEISENQIVIISTHQVHDIANLIDTVLILKEGQILLNASIQELENLLYCGIQAEAPAPDQVFYSELRAGGYAVLRANQNEGPSAIDLGMLFQAFLHNNQIAQQFAGDSHV
ncbi:MAG: ABC transporter ATP-binding protein [Gammaproteobacteria bacterium]|nr:ABC transporter ATP-binding protein [Gammaproteobacteria bacterium]